MSALARLARTSAEPAAGERCDVCGAPLSEAHRHLADIEGRRLLCVCDACRILFDRTGAGGGRFRLVPTRRRLLPDLALDDALWARLRIPVDVAFFLHSSAGGRVVALYPGPMGATESQLELDAWAEIAATLPDMEPDVEALLVRRPDDHFLVPIDDCYRLVGAIRSSWRGLGGGEEAWRTIGEFFDELRKEAE